MITLLNTKGRALNVPANLQAAVLSTKASEMNSDGIKFGTNSSPGTYDKSQFCYSMTQFHAVNYTDVLSNFDVLLFLRNVDLVYDLLPGYRKIYNNNIVNVLSKHGLSSDLFSTLFKRDNKGSITPVESRFYTKYKYGGVDYVKYFENVKFNNSGSIALSKRLFILMCELESI